MSECSQPSLTHLTITTEDEHEYWKTMLSGQLHLAKFESVSNVLDIRTGQGHWAIDFGMGSLPAEHLQLT